MEYGIRQLCELAGVSGRTLRYYHQIGLLTPLRTTGAGYRVYGPAQVDRLQQILFYRRMGLPLAEIRALLDAEGFDALEALRSHRRLLLDQRRDLDTLIATVERSIAAKEGSKPMNDKEKFQGFKRELIENNEAQYGAEVRRRYGDAAADAANAKLMNLTQEAYDRMRALEQELLDTLDRAFLTGDPAGLEGQRTAALHREWLGYSWPEYAPDAHAGLAELYVADERFAAYYDRGQPGRAQFLRDAIAVYTSVL